MKLPFAPFSRPPQIKGARLRPLVEPLENRIAPAFTAGPGVGTINGDGNGDTLIIDVGTGADAGKLHHSALGGSFFNDFDWDSATAGEQAILVTGAWSLVVNAGGGDDTITFGTAASPAVQLGTLGTIAVHGDAHSLADALSIDNTADATGRAIGVSATQITIAAGTGPTINYDTLETVGVSGGGGNDTFTLTGSTTGVGYTLTGSGGTDSVNVTTDAGYSLTSNSLTITGAGFSATAVILNTIETANLTGAASANTFTVNGWAGTANLNGGAGADIFNVIASGTFGPTSVTGGTESDTLTISGYSLTVADGTADVTVNHTGTGAGNVVLAGLGTVTFSQLEPLKLSGSAADLAINLPSTASTTTLGDDGVAANTFSRLSAATFVPTDFNNPTSTLTINRGNSADTLTINALPDFNASLTIGSAANPFGALTFAGPVTLAADKTLAASATGTISLPNAGSDLATTGTGTISLTTARDISILAGASVTTDNGNLTLSANQQVSPTSGNFPGINVTGAGALVKATGSGNVLVAGKGGDGASTQTGVTISSGGIVQGGVTGSLTVQGTGGPTTGFSNHGVSVSTTGAGITSSGGNVQVIGQGGGTGTSGTTHGVNVSAGQITAGGSGTVSVQGTGGAGSGGNQHGVNVGGSSAMITSGGGNVQVTGQGGGTGSSSTNHGIYVTAGGRVTAGGSGTVTVQGTGGSGTGFTPNDGVFLNGGTITSSGGNVQVTGTGGTASTGNPGVSLGPGGVITALNSGSVTVQGTGGALGTGNDGVQVNGIGATITSGGGNVQVTGSGNGSASSSLSDGVFLGTGGVITAGGTGTVTVQGTGGAGTGGNNYGVLITGSSSNVGTITSGGGVVQVTGIAGGGTTSVGLGIGITGATFGAITTAANGGNLTVLSNSIALMTDAVISTQAAGTATLKPVTPNTLINLGGADTTGTLGLTAAELGVISTGTLQIGDGNSGAITASVALTPAYHLSLTTGAGVTFSQAITMAANKSLTASALGTANGTISLPNSTSNLAASGTGAISLTTARNISLASGASVTTVDGNLILSANQQGTPTSGNFIGVAINGTVQATGSGSVSVAGKGGDNSGNFQYGVSIAGSGRLQGGSSGGLTVVGTGGAGSGINNVGVSVSGTAPVITSLGANVQVTGQGGGSGSSTGNAGVSVGSNGQVTAGGLGSVTVQGTGGTTTGSFNNGVLVSLIGATITSGGGAVQVIGQAGGTGASNVNVGVEVSSQGKIIGGGSGGVTVQGTGGGTNGTDNKGVTVSGNGSVINSGGGNVQVTGLGGGNSSSSGNYGVDVTQAGLIKAGGSGTVTVQGTGGPGTGFDFGVYVRLTGSTITSSGGNVQVTGQGGGAAVSLNNLGVGVVAGGLISSGGAGAVTVQGTGGVGSTGSNHGVVAGGIGITSGGSGAVTVQGTGGASGAGTYGVQVTGTITSGGGNVQVTGQGGGTVGNNVGVEISGVVTAAGSGTVTVQGTGGVGSFGTNGVNLRGTAGAPGTITSGGGAVQVTGIRGGASSSLGLAIGVSGNTFGTITTAANGGSLTLLSDGMAFTTDAIVSTQAAGTVTLRPVTTGTLIDLGGADATGTLGLTNAELNVISTGTLQIGDATSGAVTISAVISPLNYKTLSIGKGASFSSTGGFASEVTSATVYEKMQVAGALSIDPAAPLTVTAVGGYVPQANQNFTIVENTSASATTGTFLNKPEGSIVPVGGVARAITYVEGGNDVVLLDRFVSVTIGTTPVSESSTSGLIYTFARTGSDTSAALPISFTKGGTATFTNDFTASSTATSFDYNAGTLTIPAGASSVTVTLVPVNDRRVEGSETASLTVASGTGYGISSTNPSATGTFDDNDTATVTLAAPSANPQEGGLNGAARFTLTLTTNGTGLALLDRDVTIDVTDLGTGTATVGTDYTFAANPTTVTFLSGSSTNSQAFANFFSIQDDQLVEGAETVNLSAAITSGPATLSGSNLLTTSLNDNDTATVALSVPDTLAAEGGGTAAALLLLTLNTFGTGPAQLAKAVTVNVTDLGTGTAAGTDYTFTNPTALTFVPNSLNGATQTANFASIANDPLVEGTETVDLSAAIVSGPATIPGSTTLAAIIIDNDTATWSLTGSSSVTEGTNASYTISLANILLNGATATIEVALSDSTTLAADHGALTAAINAAIGARTDLVFNGTTLTFTGNGSSAMPALTFTIAATDDTLVEGDESFSVAISSPGSTTGTAVAGTDSISTTITDNDTATWSLTGSSSATEGTDASYTIALAGVLQSGEIAITTVALTDSTAVAADHGAFAAAITAAIGARSDLSFSGGTLTYTGTGSAMTALTFTIAATDDALVEGDESFTVAISSPDSTTGAVVTGTGSVSTTITDNDTATWSLTGSSSATEGTDASYTLSLAGVLQSAETARINLALSDVATLAADHGAFAAAITAAIGARTDLVFSAGTLTYTGNGSAMPALTFTIGATDDSLVEGDESFSVAISNPGSTTGAAVTGTNTVVTTITDNDTATWSLTGSSSATEGTDASYTIFLAGVLQSAETATINVALSDVTTLAADHGAFAAAITAAIGARTDLVLNAGTLTYTGNGSAMPALTFTIAATDDSLVEGDESFSVAISNPGSTTGAAVTGTGSVSTTITDNDTATWSLTGSSSATEGTDASYTLSLAGVLQSAETATTNVALSDVTTLAADHGALAAAITAAIGARTDLSFNAGTLTYTGDGSAMTALTFTIGATDDSLVEGDESFSVAISSPGSTTGAAVTGTGSVSTTITDNDTADWSLTGSSSATEGTNASYTLSLAGTLQAAETATISVALSDVSTNATDHGALVAAITAAIGARTDLVLNGTTLTYTGNGSAMPSLTFTIAVTDDSLVEGIERFSVALSSTGSTTGAAVTARGFVLTTITDNDTATWSLTGSSSATEGAGASYTISLAGVLQSGESAMIDLALSDVTTLAADHGEFAAAIMAAIGARTDLTFGTTLTYVGNGSAMPALTFTIAAIDDSLVEGDESFSVAISSPGSTTGAAVTGTGSVSTTITDSDTATWSLTGSSSATEGTDASYTLSLAGVLQSAETATIDVALSDVTTLAGDHGALAAAITAAIGARTDLVFSAGTLTYTGTGSAMTALTFTIAAIDDSPVESDESFSVAISSPGSTTGAAVTGSGSVTTTIIDNDAATVTLSGGVSKAEGQSGTTSYTFTATLNNAVQGGFSVAFTTNDGTATVADQDYTDNDGTLTFAGNAGEQQTITVLVTGDTKFENDDAFTVALGAISGAPAAVSTAGSPQTATIQNDDTTPTISIANASVVEGNAGTANAVFTVSLSNASILPVTVLYATANGSAIAPGDYAAITPTLLTFAPGQTSMDVSVAVRGDTLFEQGADETFLVNLSGPGNATLDDAQAVGTITNDDTAPANPITLDALHSFTFRDENHDKVTVKLIGPGTGTLILNGGVLTGADISEIRLTDTNKTSALSVTVTADPATGDGVVRVGEVTIDGALKSFTAKAADLSVGGFVATGAVGKITARNLLNGEIITAGTATDLLALTLGTTSAGTLIDTAQTVKALKAVRLGDGIIQAAAFTAISTSAGALAADITSAGAIAKITVKGGGLSGDLTARSFGPVSITGGDFSGSLTSLTPAATLDKIAALKSLTITNGDLTGDVRLLGKAGAISVKGKKTGPGGNVLGASIVAGHIGSLSVAKNFASSIVLAGADLGADHALGGGDDSFVPGGGTIGAVTITGNVSGNSVIGAGLKSTNTTFKDVEDVILGGVASVVASFTITGTADPDSYFAAGLFKATPKIGGANVIFPDGRFKVG